MATETKTKKAAVTKSSNNIEAKVYSQDGKEKNTVTLPESVFGVSWNADLVHQVVTGMQANARTPVAHTKDRSEVRGGGAKPWRQKGTGRARHGSRRSPIWRGGGVTFGPRNDKSYFKKINKKMRTKALYSVLSRKLLDGEILFVDELSFAEPKTAEAKEIILSLGGLKGFEQLRNKRANAAMLALPEKSITTAKSFRNFSNLLVDEIRNLNPVTALQYKYIIITNPETTVPQLEKRSESKK